MIDRTCNINIHILHHCCDHLQSHGHNISLVGKPIGRSFIVRYIASANGPAYQLAGQIGSLNYFSLLTTTLAWHTIPSKLYNINSRSGQGERALLAHILLWPTNTSGLHNINPRSEPDRANGNTCIFARSTPQDVCHQLYRNGRTKPLAYVFVWSAIPFYNIKYSRT